MERSRWLTVVVVLQGMILLGQWTGGGSLAVARAENTLPDPGARQMQMVEELKASNAKLERIIAILESGNLQVQVAQPDENKGGRK